MTIKYNKLLFTHLQQPVDSFTTSNQHTSTHIKPQMFTTASQQSWRLSYQKKSWRAWYPRSLLYSSYCCILNSSNSLSVFSIFLFSSSTCSTRLVELSSSATSYSRSILSADVSVLVELVWIPAFFKKGYCRFPRRGPCLGGCRGPCKQHKH